MERVIALLDKIKEQVEAGKPVSYILPLVQQLQSELVHPYQEVRSIHNNFTTVVMAPVAKVDQRMSGSNKVIEQEPEHKVVQVLKVNEEEVLAELEEIRRNAEIRLQLSAKNKPEFKFDPIEDIPTLYQQTAPSHTARGANTSDSPEEKELNERLKSERTELADSLQDAPIKDLKKAIGLNDRFAFINELFRGDEAMYERSIKTINNFAIYAEAEYWIKRELKLKLGWDEKLPIVKQFDQLVRRRFS